MSAKNPTRAERSARLAELTRELVTAAEELRDEIQQGFDNMPESFQEGSAGEKATERIDTIEDAISSLESAADEFESYE